MAARASAKIIELSSPSDYRIHGNLSRTPTNQLRRKLGVYSHVAYINDENGVRGSVRQCITGKCFDWWLNEWGDVVVVESH